MKKNLFFLSIFSLVLFTSCEPTRPTPPNARNGAMVTENDADRAVTQRIIVIIKEDPALTPTAQNVRVSTANGIVTLRGMVNSDREKQTIENKAKMVSGVRNVDNQLEVKR